MWPGVAGLSGIWVSVDRREWALRDLLWRDPGYQGTDCFGQVRTGSPRLSFAWPGVAWSRSPGPGLALSQCDWTLRASCCRGPYLLSLGWRCQARQGSPGLVLGGPVVAELSGARSGMAWRGQAIWGPD